MPIPGASTRNHDFTFGTPSLLQSVPYSVAVGGGAGRRKCLWLLTLRWEEKHLQERMAPTTQSFVLPKMRCDVHCEMCRCYPGTS